MRKNGIFLLSALMIIALAGLAFSAACPNRDIISSSCTCNGASVSSGYCCYYDPSAGNVTWQASTTCGYTKWSPHYQSMFLSRPYNVYYSSQTSAANHWLAETTDYLVPLGDADKATMKAYNPNIKLADYQLLESVMFQGYAGGVQDGAMLMSSAQAYANSHGCDYENFFNHFSSDAHYTVRDFDGTINYFDIPGYPGSTAIKNASRVVHRGWGSNRYVWNMKYQCTKDFLANYYYNYTHSGAIPLDGVFYDEINMAFPLLNDYCTINTPGTILEYANQAPTQIKLEYAQDVASAFSALRAASPDKFFMPNTATAYYGKTSELYAMGNGASGLWQESWILVGWDGPRDYQVSHDMAAAGKLDFMDQEPTTLSTLSPGLYSSNMERIHMTGLSWFYLGRDNGNRYVIFSVHGMQTYYPMDPPVDYPAAKTDIGNPTTIIPTGKTSAGGTSGADGVYELQRGTDPTGTAYVVYAREYDKALVLQRWPTNYAGTRSALDDSAATFTLPGTYYLLTESGTSSSPMTSITLRNFEGAILMGSGGGGSAPSPPVLSSLQCQVGGTWGACSSATYGQTISAARAQCTTANGSITSVSFTITNSPDSSTLLSGSGSLSSGYYVLSSPTTIQDSGNFTLTATCIASTGLSSQSSTTWSVAWGTLTAQHLSPANLSSYQNASSFTYSVRLTCNSGECGSVSATLDPTFGNTNASGSVYYPDLEDSSKLGSRFQMGSSAGLLNNMTVRLYLYSGRTYYGAVYQDNSGVPGTKIADAQNTISQSGATTQVVFYFNNESLQGNAYYWLVVGSSGGTTRVYEDPGYSGQTAANAGIPTVSSTFGSGISYQSAAKHMFAGYTLGGSGGTLPNPKGVVPTGSGNPFYTTSSNPQTCSNMKGGDTCTSSWTVVPNTVNASFIFYVIFSPSQGGVNGIESPYINISVGNSSSPPQSTPAPVISSVLNSSITSSSAAITWTTDVSSNTTVLYGTSSGSYPLSAGANNNVTAHAVSLSSLSSSTAYYYIARSCNANNCTNSSQYSFITSSSLPYTPAPVISSVSNSSITNTSAVVNWTTDINSNTTVLYGTASGSYSRSAGNNVNSTSHSVSISSLIPSTIYYYIARSCNSGNCTNSSQYSFTTNSSPSTPAPVISNVSNSSITYSSATINWTTNITSNSTVFYGTSSGSYSLTAGSTANVTAHSVYVVGLSASTSYFYLVRSCNVNNCTNSSQYTFTTSTAPSTPTPAPVISSVLASSITQTSASITWTTDINSNTTAFYGTSSGSYSLSAGASDNTTAHSILLSGLTQNTAYFYLVGSCNSNNCTNSTESNFTTLATPTGCDYSNPPCDSGYTCSSNTCVLIPTGGTGGGGGGGGSGGGSGGSGGSTGGAGGSSGSGGSGGSGGGGGGGGGGGSGGIPVPVCQPIGGICAIDSDCCQGACYSNYCVSQTPDTVVPKKVKIEAPAYDKLYSAVVVNIYDENDKPMTGVLVYVLAPNSEVTSLVTDENGEVRFAAQQEGWYAYNVPDYDVIMKGSTYVSKATAAAAVCGDTICQVSETCTNCEADCGKCIVAPPKQAGTDWTVIAIILAAVAGILGFGVLTIAGGFWYFKVRKPKAHNGLLKQEEIKSEIAGEGETEGGNAGPAEQTEEPVHIEPKEEQVHEEPKPEEPQGEKIYEEPKPPS